MIGIPPPLTSELFAVPNKTAQYTGGRQASMPMRMLLLPRAKHSRSPPCRTYHDQRNGVQHPTHIIQNAKGHPGPLIDIQSRNCIAKDGRKCRADDRRAVGASHDLEGPKTAREASVDNAANGEAAGDVVPHAVVQRLADDGNVPGVGWVHVRQRVGRMKTHIGNANVDAGAARVDDIVGEALADVFTLVAAGGSGGGGVKVALGREVELLGERPLKEDD